MYFVIKHLAASAAFALATSVSAATITIGGWSFAPGGDNIQFSTSGGASFENAGASRFTGTVIAESGVPPGTIVPGGGTIFAYCYDLFNDLSSGTFNVAPGGAASPTLDFLGAVNAVLGGGSELWLNPGSGDVAAAIQLGIWESKYDGTFDLGSGAFQATGLDPATLAQFNAFVAAMATSGSASGSQVMLLVGNGQDLITARRGNFDVPEPGTLALFALGTALVGWVRRREHR
jgi:hypothetical protein